MRIAAVATALALVLAACSGGDDSREATASVDATSASTSAAEDAQGVGERGPVWIVVAGQEHALETDLCYLGDDDSRELWAFGADGFPRFELSYLAPDIVSLEYTAPDGVARYRTNDVGAVAVTITDSGATGTATLDSLTGQEDPAQIEFGFECLDQEPVQAEADDDAATDDADPGADGEATKSGFVEWAGARSDLSDEDFDPQAGTGLCETQDVTGLEEGDYYRIVTTLDDGTDFSLTSRDGLQLGDTFDPIETTIADLTQDGRTVSGSADTPTGPLNFSFTC